MRTTASKIKTSLRGLTTELIDYAGLFPPASLDMQSAVENYANYRKSEYRWMLGRFVVPASRLAEFESAARGVDSAGWGLSALVAQIDRDLRCVLEFNARYAGKIIADAVELKAGSLSDISHVQQSSVAGVITYFEIDPGSQVELLRAIRDMRARAKVRTGGTSPEMFPSTASVAKFLLGCADVGVAFKATAGLHHPIRCVKPLTYKDDAPRGVMHGFLNVFVAAALTHANVVHLEHLTELLNCEDPDEIRFEDEYIRWRDLSISCENVISARKQFAISFGSCSFVEPVEDLQELGLL